MKSKKNGMPVSVRRPRWKRHTDDYGTDQLSRLKFASDHDIDAAIEIVWGGPLHGMPFQLGGDGESLIVPKIGVPYFVKAGLSFNEVIVSNKT